MSASHPVTTLSPLSPLESTRRSGTSSKSKSPVDGLQQRHPLFPRRWLRRCYGSPAPAPGTSTCPATSPPEASSTYHLLSSLLGQTAAPVASLGRVAKRSATAFLHHSCVCPDVTEKCPRAIKHSQGNPDWISYQSVHNSVNWALHIEHNSLLNCG